MAIGDDADDNDDDDNEDGDDGNDDGSNMYVSNACTISVLFRTLSAPSPPAPLTALHGPPRKSNFKKSSTVCGEFAHIAVLPPKSKTVSLNILFQNQGWSIKSFFLIPLNVFGSGVRTTRPVLTCF